MRYFGTTIYQIICCAARFYPPQKQFSDLYLPVGLGEFHIPRFGTIFREAYIYSRIPWETAYVYQHTTCQKVGTFYVNRVNLVPLFYMPVDVSHRHPLLDLLKALLEISPSHRFAVRHVQTFDERHIVYGMSPLGYHASRLALAV